MAGEAKPHPTPCKCESACTAQCVCLTKNMCCETDCGCPENCENRYRGCYCLAGQCRSKQCPCFAAERECDSNICRNCSICDGDGSTVGQPAQKSSCNNMNLQKGLCRRLYRGSTELPGWGLFNSDFIKKDDFIGEYVGEVITNEEANKRQAEHPGSSYFFQLDDETFFLNSHIIKHDPSGGHLWSLDVALSQNTEYITDAGKSIWNLLRFGNHSTNRANCYAVCMLVKGQYRIALFAKEHIEAESELFLDYGPQFHWNGTEKIELPPKVGTSGGRSGKKSKRKKAKKA